MGKKGGKKSRNKQTPLQKEYNKTWQNLERRVESALKRGYSWEKPLLTEKPKKITQKSLQALKNKNKIFYEKARYKDPITGKETSGKRGREIERSRAGKKGAETRKKNKTPPPPPPPPPVSDAVLKGLLEYLNSFVPDNSLHNPSALEQEDRVNHFYFFLTDAINDIGYEELAQRLEQNAETIWGLVDKYIFSSKASSDNAWFSIKTIIRQQNIDYDIDDAGYGLDDEEEDY